MRRLLIAVPLLFLALASPALAGGWATVGLSSTPDGVTPGKPWVVDITVLQHGRTPLEGVKPSLTIRNGDARRTFHARATEAPGVYRVAVTFPSAGSWAYEVDDGFVSGQPHTFKPVQIAAPAPASARPDGGGPSLTWLIGGLALIAAAAALLLARRLSHHRPQAA